MYTPEAKVKYEGHGKPLYEISCMQSGDRKVIFNNLEVDPDPPAIGALTSWLFLMTAILSPSKPEKLHPWISIVSPIEPENFENDVMTGAPS